MSVQIALAAEVDRLRHDIERHVEIACELATECESLRAENTDLRNANQILRDALDAERAELASKQAEIDRLMLEYCPDEMTPEQFDTWAAHQRVSDLKIEAARKGEGG